MGQTRRGKSLGACEVHIHTTYWCITDANSVEAIYHTIPAVDFLARNFLHLPRHEDVLPTSPLMMLEWFRASRSAGNTTKAALSVNNRLLRGLRQFLCVRPEISE
jgi:hypothetical protein